ncbi:hypothetical protein HT136_09720 [Novosphingobium profundi]|uniref:hypothetical protein n=1 Tax=Novosphingobium profundi TaxID=1774954 RepID=UPI001BDA9D24|nr:hypothetical protein [Novosphingobium profundi]MBT0668644.1 hypothetical protein [Novosphingobium profundi]
MRSLSKPIFSVIMIASAIGVTGCSSDSKAPDKVRLGELPYEFPDGDILNIVQPDHGRTFVRLEPPNEDFLLVKDEFADRMQKKTGEVIVSNINSNRFNKVDRFKRDDIDVFCKDTPYYSCGMQVSDRGVIWSIIFDRIDVDNAHKIKSRALLLLSKYRSWR